jgi:hypothetical protein
VRANRGAAGIDRVTLAAVEQYGVGRLLDELTADLKEGSYRPLPARRVFIPKSGSQERRPLSIPDCLEAIPHKRLMQAIEERIVDRQAQAPARPAARGGDGGGGGGQAQRQRYAAGRGRLAPALQRLPQPARPGMADTGQGVLCRYADDLVVMRRTEGEARCPLAALRALLAELGLEPKDAKTRIVHLREGGEGFDFLGFHHRYVRGRTRRSRNITFLARWPSRQAMQHARDRIRELTGRERLLLPVEDVVQDVNRFLRGWVGYFRYGNSARPFDKIDRYAITQLSLFVAKRHRAPTRYGWKLVAYESPNRMGLDQPERTRHRTTTEPAVAGRAGCRR